MARRGPLSPGLPGLAASLCREATAVRLWAFRVYRAFVQEIMLDIDL